MTRRVSGRGYGTSTMTQFLRILCRTMGDFDGEHRPTRPSTVKRCPRCHGPMSHSANLCVVCSGARNAGSVRKEAYGEKKMDRHRRWSALLELGFTNEELIGMRPFLFSREQIDEMKALVKEAQKGL